MRKRKEMLASQKGGVYMHRVRNLVGFLHIVLLVPRFSDLAFDGRTVAGAFLHPPFAGGGSVKHPQAQPITRNPSEAADEVSQQDVSDECLLKF